MVRTALWLAAVLAAGGNDAQAPAAATTEAACPAARMPGPRYPADAMRRGLSGKVVVQADIDACGRVTAARVHERSRHRVLDDAALAAVTGWVVNDALRAKAVDGQLRVPLSFGGTRTVDVVDLPWPRSHRQPVYVADDQPIGDADIAAWFAAERTREPTGDRVYRQPYAMTASPGGGRIITTIAPDRDDATVFWLTYADHRPAAAAPTTAAERTLAVARYRLVTQDGEPQARVALLCRVAAEECDKLRAFLLQGLPSAKPR